MGSTYLNKDGLPVTRVGVVEGDINIDQLDLVNDPENPLYVKNTNTEEEAIPVKLTGSFIEYRGKSTDTKPTPDNVGDTFFEIDTTDVYMWDGSGWELI